MRTVRASSSPSVGSKEAGAAARDMVVSLHNSVLCWAWRSANQRPLTPAASACSRAGQGSKGLPPVAIARPLTPTSKSADHGCRLLSPTCAAAQTRVRRAE